MRHSVKGRSKVKAKGFYSAVSLVLLLLIVVRIVHVNTNVLTIRKARKKPVVRAERCLSGNG